jgi:uncharacterized membrane protein
MKKKSKTLFVLIIALVFILVWSSFSHFLFNMDFYKKEYKKNGTYEIIPENLSIVVTENLFRYFQNQEQLRYFSDEEKNHLADVKVLIGIGYALYALAIIVAVFCVGLIFRRNLGKRHMFHYANAGRDFFSHLSLASLITLAGVALFFLVGLLFGFDGLFTAFHQVFFPQGNWSFPEYYPLIVLFPGRFFEDISMQIGLRILLVSGAAFVISRIALALSRDKP